MKKPIPTGFSCRVCEIAVHDSRLYYQRNMICEDCSKKSCCDVNGQQQRWCQQCRKFQGEEDFDDERRTCRVRLDRHNSLRKRRHDYKIAPRKANTQNKKKKAAPSIADTAVTEAIVPDSQAVAEEPKPVMTSAFAAVNTSADDATTPVSLEEVGPLLASRGFSFGFARLPTATLNDWLLNSAFLLPAEHATVTAARQMSDTAELLAMAEELGLLTDALPARLPSLNLDRALPGNVFTAPAKPTAEPVATYNKVDNVQVPHADSLLSWNSPSLLPITPTHSREVCNIDMLALFNEYSQE